MSVDPLSAESLSQVPEVRDADAAYQAALDSQTPTGESYDSNTLKKRLALLLAVRDATLKAERERLLALTPEAAVAQATAEMVFCTEGGIDEGQARSLIEVALPILLAPEAAKREQVEEEVKDLNERGWELDSKLRAAEAEATRLREVVSKYENLIHNAAIAQERWEKAVDLLCVAMTERRAALGGSND